MSQGIVWSAIEFSAELRDLCFEKYESPHTGERHSFTDKFDGASHIGDVVLAIAALSALRTTGTHHCFGVQQA